MTIDINSQSPGPPGIPVSPDPQAAGHRDAHPESSESYYSLLSSAEKNLLDNPNVIFITCRRTQLVSESPDQDAEGHELKSTYFAFDTENHELLIIRKDSALTGLGMRSATRKEYQSKSNDLTIKELTFDPEGRKTESARPLHMHQWLEGITDLAPSMLEEGAVESSSTWLTYYSQLVRRGLVPSGPKDKAKAKSQMENVKEADKVSPTILRLDLPDGPHTLLPVSLASVFMLHMMCTNADTVGLPTYQNSGGQLHDHGQLHHTQLHHNQGECEGHWEREGRGRGKECFLLPVPPEEKRNVADQELFVSVSEDVGVWVG